MSDTVNPYGKVNLKIYLKSLKDYQWKYDWWLYEIGEKSKQRKKRENDKTEKVKTEEQNSEKIKGV